MRGVGEKSAKMKKRGGGSIRKSCSRPSSYNQAILKKKIEFVTLNKKGEKGRGLTVGGENLRDKKTPSKDQGRRKGQTKNEGV